jgi:peptidyl-prolyl cis-trans isomerase SurA
MKSLFTLRHTKTFVQCFALFLGTSGAMAQTVANAPVTSAPAPSSASRVQFSDAIVAVVNNDVITRQELMTRANMIERRMQRQGITLPPQPEFQRQVLERLIVDKAQLQMAKDSGIKVDDSIVDRAVARIAEQNKMSLQEFRNQVERDGTTFPRFREELRNEITMQRLREREVDNKIQISESEIENYLAAQQGSSQAQQEYDIAQILIRTPENATAEQMAARHQRAEEVLQQLRTGADFAKTAATYSDSSDALTGGDLGWRNQDRLPQLFLNAVVNLKPGQVSAIVQSPNGFHILKLVGLRSASAGNPQSVPSVQQTHARHILIKVNQIVTAADARRKLMELKERLNNNAAKFEDLAKLYSNDLSASNGGDLGWIYPGDTVPEFERAMDALQPGQISDPVESPFGFHLIQVLERKTDDVSKERLRMAARQAIRERKLDEATQDWLRQLRDQAYVEYRLDTADAPADSSTASR